MTAGRSQPRSSQLKPSTVKATHETPKTIFKAMLSRGLMTPDQAAKRISPAPSQPPGRGLPANSKKSRRCISAWLAPGQTPQRHQGFGADPHQGDARRPRTCAPTTKSALHTRGLQSTTA
ncbi:hypothetical protein N431DRAFT_554794 [Stipitochalara longipes BDJ]|nr:hypothetical protein N431DRAFT_554794 [Stipitochalara longipes BDJ]